MIAKLLPAIIALAGLGTGVGAGIALRPEPADPIAETAASACGVPADSADAHGAPAGEHAEAEPHAATSTGHAAPDRRAASAAGNPGDGHDGAATEFVKIDDQFIVPVIEDQRVAAMVILSLTLEVASGQSGGTHARLPKLRDRFLRAMLDHANVGGFSGTFTADGSVEQLRRNLIEVGRKELGAVLSDVLILDMNRQSV